MNLFNRRKLKTGGKFLKKIVFIKNKKITVFRKDFKTLPNLLFSIPVEFLNFSSVFSNLKFCRFFLEIYVKFVKTKKLRVGKKLELICRNFSEKSLSDEKLNGKQYHKISTEFQLKISLCYFFETEMIIIFLLAAVHYVWSPRCWISKTGAGLHRTRQTAYQSGNGGFSEKIVYL